MDDETLIINAREMVEFKFEGLVWQVCLVENPDETFQAVINAIPPPGMNSDDGRRWVRDCVTAVDGRREWLRGVKRVFSMFTRLAAKMSLVGSPVAFDVISYNTELNDILGEAKDL